MPGIKDVYEFYSHHSITTIILLGYNLKCLIKSVEHAQYFIILPGSEMEPIVFVPEIPRSQGPVEPTSYVIHY